MDKERTRAKEKIMKLPGNIKLGQVFTGYGKAFANEKINEAKLKKGDHIKSMGEVGVVNKIKGQVAYVKFDSNPKSFHPILVSTVKYKGKHKGKDLYEEGIVNEAVKPIKLSGNLKKDLKTVTDIAGKMVKYAKDNFNTYIPTGHMLSQLINGGSTEKGVLKYNISHLAKAINTDLKKKYMKDFMGESINEAKSKSQKQLDILFKLSIGANVKNGEDRLYKLTQAWEAWNVDNDDQYDDLLDPLFAAVELVQDAGEPGKNNVTKDKEYYMYIKSADKLLKQFNKDAKKAMKLHTEGKLTEVKIGDMVKIDKAYGGGKGKVKDKKGSFVVVNGSSYHESDVKVVNESVSKLTEGRKHALLRVEPRNYEAMIDKLQDMNINHNRESRNVIKVYTDRIPSKVLYKLTHDVYVDKFVLKEGKLTEGRGKKVSKNMWKKMSDDEKYNALLTVVKDPDEAEEYIESKWSDLPSGFERDMYTESVVNEAKVWTLISGGKGFIKDVSGKTTMKLKDALKFKNIKAATKASSTMANAGVPNMVHVMNETAVPPKHHRMPDGEIMADKDHVDEGQPIFQDTPNELAYLDFKKWANKNRKSVHNILVKAVEDGRDPGTDIFLALRQVWLAWANKKAKEFSRIPNKGPEGKDFGRALAVMMKKDNLIIKRSGNKLTDLGESNSFVDKLKEAAGIWNKPDKLNEMDINDPVLVAMRAFRTSYLKKVKKGDAAPKVKKISMNKYYKLMDKESDLIDQMKDASKELAGMFSDMNQEAGQKGAEWTDADANRYGGDLDKLQSKYEKLAKEKAKVKDQIMNYRIN